MMLHDDSCCWLGILVSLQCTGYSSVGDWSSIVAVYVDCFAFDYLVCSEVISSCLMKIRIISVENIGYTRFTSDRGEGVTWHSVWLKGLLKLRNNGMII